MSERNNRARLPAREEREALVRAIRDGRALRGPNEFVAEVKVPADLAAALASGRTELLALVRPRAIEAEEFMALVHLISVLLRTNLALQEHAREVAVMAKTLSGNFKGLVGFIRQVEQFADFRLADDDEDES